MTALTYTLACHYCPFSKQEFNMRAKLTLLSVLKTSLVGAQHKKLVYLLAGPGRVYYVTMCGQDWLMVSVVRAGCPD